MTPLVHQWAKQCNPPLLLGGENQEYSMSSCAHHHIHPAMYTLLPLILPSLPNLTSGKLYRTHIASLTLVLCSLCLPRLFSASHLWANRKVFESQSEIERARLLTSKPSELTGSSSWSPPTSFWASSLYWNEMSFLLCLCRIIKLCSHLLLLSAALLIGNNTG